MLSKRSRGLLVSFAYPRLLAIRRHAGKLAYEKSRLQ